MGACRNGRRVGSFDVSWVHGPSCSSKAGCVQDGGIDVDQALPNSIFDVCEIRRSHVPCSKSINPRLAVKFPCWREIHSTPRSVAEPSPIAIVGRSYDMGRRTLSKVHLDTTVWTGQPRSSSLLVN